MEYRKEIDGLRALAVLPVIFFHAGFEMFSGGYVGVDVFFVISGYLITSIILSELEQGRFSIVSFYERRARRILPTLFLVMFICIPFAWLWMMPNDMKDFSKSLVAVSLFFSNILFSRESGYFDTAAELKPLLHTWSLAVEEQFYVIFPLILMLFWKLGKRWILISLGILFFSSLALAQWGALAKPSAAFYILPTRAWELLTGSFAALYLSHINRKEFRKSTSEIGGWLGVSLIFYAVFTFSKTTPFPGLYALVPVLGAVLIVLFATQQTFVGKFVGNKVFVGIGLISYSTYLWHQPLFAFARYLGNAETDPSVFLPLSIFSMFLGYMSWKFVESPFRDKKLISKNTIFICMIFCSILLISFGIYGHKKNGDVGQLNAEQKSFLSYFDNDISTWKYFTIQKIPEKFRIDCDFYDISKYRSGNITKVPIEHISKSCYTKNKADSKVVFIWGDSHAQQLYYGLNKNLPTNFEVLQVASSGCTASLIFIENKINFCEYSNWFAYNIIKKQKPHVVVIGRNLGHDTVQMNSLAENLKSIGIGKVIFTGPSPHWTPSLPIILTRTLPNVPLRTYFGVDKGVLELDRKLKSESNNLPTYNYVSLIDFFCDKKGCLTHYTSDIAANVTSWDYGHLTPIASDKLAKEILVPTIVKD